MSVSIACAACSAPVRLGDTACRKCGRALSQDERIALEARFESTNTDYREAKLTVSRALTASLVVGLLTILFGSVRLVLELTSDAGFSFTSSSATAVVDLVAGLTLVTCFFGSKRSATVSLSIATAIWVSGVVLPIVAAPAQAILRLASPGGVAITLARLGVLLLLLQGIPAGIRMKRLLEAPPG